MQAHVKQVGGGEMLVIGSEEDSRLVKLSERDFARERTNETGNLRW